MVSDVLDVPCSLIQYRPIPRYRVKGNGPLADNLRERLGCNGREAVQHAEYRMARAVATLDVRRHRSSVVELSIRNRAVVGSNPTGGSVPSAQAPNVTLCPLALSDAARPVFSTDLM